MRTAPKAPSPNQAYDVDLMRRLVEQRTTATGRVQFLRTTRAVEEICIIERSDHAHRAEGAALDQRACLQDRSVEGMAVPNNQVHTCTCAGFDHFGGVIKRERHWLFDQQVLSSGSAETRMFRVVLMRGGDVHDVDRVIVAQFFDRAIRPAPEIGFKTRARLGPRIGRRYQRDAWIALKRRQHNGEGTAQSGHTDAQLARNPLFQRPLPARQASPSRLAFNLDI